MKGDKKTYSTQKNGNCYACLTVSVLAVLTVAIIGLFYPMATDFGPRVASLEAKDMILMQNVSDLDTQATQEESNRLAKDMILMQNVTDLGLLVAVETAARIAKDMILMQNVTDLDALIAQEELARAAKDMLLMQNVSDLDARIIQEEAARIAKDMILMQNVTDLLALIDLIGNTTNATAKVTDLMMMVMTLEANAFTHIEDGYGTDLSVSPTATPSGVGRTLRVDLNVAGSPTISITPGPSPAGTVTWDTNAAGLVTQLDAAPTMGPTWADNICGDAACAKITSLTGDSGPATTASAVTVEGGTHVTTTSTAAGIKVNVDAASVCATCPGGGGGGIFNITASSGGSTTGSSVTLAQGTGISTVRSGDTVTIANTGVTSLIPSIGFPVSGAVSVNQNAGIYVIGSGGNALAIGADFVNSPTVSFTPTPSPLGVGITASISNAPIVNLNAHWCSVRMDNMFNDWNHVVNINVAHRTQFGTTTLWFSEGISASITGFFGFQGANAFFTPTGGDAFKLCVGLSTQENYGGVPGVSCTGGLGGPCTCDNPPLVNPLTLLPAVPCNQFVSVPSNTSPFATTANARYSYYVDTPGFRTPVEGLIFSGIPTLVPFMTLSRDLIISAIPNVRLVFQSHQFTYFSSP